MSLNDLHKNIFVYYLSAVRSMFYKVLLDGNNQILNTFQLTTPNKTVPLWMVTGGEGINFYSSEASKTPTKDIDAKLLFTGDYTVPSSFFSPDNMPANITHLRKLIQENYPGILNPPETSGPGFDFSNTDMQSFSESINNLVTNEWIPYSTANGASPQNNMLWQSGFDTRGNILWACMNGWDTQNGNLIYLDSSGNNTSLNFGDINAHIQSTSNDYHTVSLDLGDGQGDIERNVKIYLVKTPYLHVGRQSDAFPYTCQDANGGLQGIRPTDDNELNQIQNRLDFLHALDPTNKLSVWQTYYTAISFMNMRRYLMSLVGVAILVDGSTGQNYLLQEGVLDLFLDYTAGDVKGGKIYYENKLSDGMIPNILKQVDYCGKSGYIRVPTLNWLIYDQTRMLYHSLRLQQVGHHGWTDDGVDPYEGWVGFEDGKQGKYFNKLKGMLNTYLDVINRLEQSYNMDKATIVQNLQQCTDETMCAPSMFISYLYENIFPTEFVTEQAQAAPCAVGIGGKKRGKTRRRKNKSTRKRRTSTQAKKAKSKHKNKSKK